MLPEILKSYVQSSSIVTASPGRINLIGEHTDYNDGFVLPAAIDKKAYIVLTPRNDAEIHLYSIDYDTVYRTNVHELSKAEGNIWPNYLLGVVDEFKKRGVSIDKGFDLAITGDIPPGAGLSSSAAVECAMALALQTAYNTSFSRLELALIGQSAENNFVGMNCGIMDQFASVFGKKDHLIELDCRSKEFRYVPFRLEGMSILLLDSNVKHSLASSEYNTRRKECEKGVALVQKHYPNVKSLRDVTMDMLDTCVRDVNDTVYRRCRYVVGEIARLQTACDDLRQGNLEGFGAKMFETHDGLSQDYEVSCAELDFLVDSVRNQPDVIGARMMGGGFGGCTINIIQDTAVATLLQTLAPLYQEKFGKPFKHYIGHIDDGTALLS